MSEPLPADAAAPGAPQQLPRVLGLGDAVAMVVGSIIGSGIFLKVSNVDLALGDFGFGPIIGVWIVMGLVTLCGSLALAELAAMFPHAGGPYLYMREAYGRLPAFLWGWTEFWIVRPCSVGALSCATALYLGKIVELSHIGQECVAIGIVVFLSIANILSTRWGASLMNLFTAIKLLFLASLIVLPTALGFSNFVNWTPVLQTTSQADWSTALGAAIMAVMWPYHGWVNLTPVAEDIRDPQRNVPKALGLGLLVVILVYVGANLSYHLVMPISAIAQTKTIAADVCQVMFGPIGAQIAAAGVMCSTFGAANSSMMCGPRVLLAMSRDNLFPSAARKLHPRWQTPMNAILIQSTWAVLLILAFYAGKADPKAVFDGLTDAVVLAALIFDGATVAAVYTLRARRAEQNRPYRTWGYPITPALLLGVYTFVFFTTLQKQWQKTTVVISKMMAGSKVDVPEVLETLQTAVVIATIAAGVVCYLWVARFGKSQSTADTAT
jgi:APA family basic amino acid/polyamine antiporter